ncbi:PadR family transcriptional regulator [Alteromonas ponticola]|uniref:PadR family transcriptional regulator n=1 Tax=Alteromonas aquimaris TaxID=2998417 RepID=A0ABT3P8K2_9ALTE|nr:PadR family transcriptional regulator [Alteromonas aquimaris]MCW8109097.1 PadR family transcriptional regulator [Alteromonas aquimaris]
MEKDNSAAKWDVQLRKGTLDMVILAALKGRSLYGLALLNLLQKLETTAITEGTLYPLLDRLKKEGVVSAQWVQEGTTRPRKYYSLTPEGKAKLNILTERWRKSVSDMEFLLANPGPATF